METLPLALPTDLLFENRLPPSSVFGYKTYHNKDGSLYFVTSERIYFQLTKKNKHQGTPYSFRRYSIREIGPGGVVRYLPGTTRGQFETGAKAHKFAKDQDLGVPAYDITNLIAGQKAQAEKKKPSAPKGEMIAKVGKSVAKPKAASPRIPFEWIGSQSQD